MLPGTCTPTGNEIMKLKEKAQVKDSILNYLIGLKDVSTRTISDALGIDLIKTNYLLEELRDDNMLVKPMENQPENDGTCNYFATLSNKGLYFLELDGGYTGRFQDDKRKHFKVVGTNAILVVQGVLIVILGFMNVNTNDNTGLSRENIKLTLKNNSLENEVARLREENNAIKIKLTASYKLPVKKK